MKAAVITLHSVCNYGTQLQLYATQEKLKEYFDEVEIIDYKRSDTYGMGLLKTFIKGNIFKAPIIIPTLLYWKKVFGGFQKKYIKLSKKEYLKDSDFINYSCNADAYFTGSDQVWNTGWNKGIIPQYYLSFVNKEKPKFAYAASFGLKELPLCDIEKSKGFISEYKYITVREASGVDILKNQYNYNNASRIIDPTLAVEPQFWRKVAPKGKIKEKYILIYNLQRSREFDQYASELAKRTGLKLYRFCTRFDQIIKNGKSILIPDIFEFITLIDNASIVLTDSFHATAFSMNLNTEPICLYPSEYSGRLSEFLDLVNCLDRHPHDYNDFSVLDRHVDFDEVNKVLAQERKKVDDFFDKYVMPELGIR